MATFYRSIVGLGIVALLGTTAFFLVVSEGQQPPDVVLVSIDTLRADVLSVYGATNDRTVATARISKGGVVYERAMTPMPLTRPTHFSLLTGRYPREHGVLNNVTSLPSKALTLTEILEAEGYQTGAFVAAKLLGSDSGAAQGFRAFCAPKRPQIRARRVVDRAITWLRDLDKTRPVFLWLHLFDPHQPYHPPKKHRPTSTPIDGLDFPAEIRWETLTPIAAQHNGDIPTATLEYARSLYRGEVEAVEHELLRLFDTYEELRQLDNVLLIVVADHGECFEGGIFFEHSDCLFEGALRVPLIIRYPHGRWAGERRTQLVSLVDIMPTILSELEISTKATISGVPLQTLNDPDRSVLIQHPLFERDNTPYRLRGIHSVGGMPVRPRYPSTGCVGLVYRDWKYVRSDSGEELFRVVPLADETMNVVEHHPNIAKRLRVALNEQLRRYPLKVLQAQELTPELQETLQALGYIE